MVDTARCLLTWTSEPGCLDLVSGADTHCLCDLGLGILKPHLGYDECYTRKCIPILLVVAMYTDIFWAEGLLLSLDLLKVSDLQHQVATSLNKQ